MSTNDVYLRQPYRFTPEMFQMIKQVKDEYMLLQDSETVRMVIREHRRMIQQKDEAVEIVNTLKELGLMA